MEIKPMRTPDLRALILLAAACGATGWPLLNAKAARAQGPQERVQEMPDARAMAARMDRMQQQLDAAEREIEEYRSALDTLRRQVQAMSDGGAPASAPGSADDASALRQAVADLREEQSVEQSEIAVHEQAKVETRSRYNLKVGGLVLFNAFQNMGQVDSIDVPAIAEARTPGTSHGTEGASLRQSLITLDATGPQFWGARTYANVQMDFFGDLS